MSIDEVCNYIFYEYFKKDDWPVKPFNEKFQTCAVSLMNETCRIDYQSIIMMKLKIHHQNYRFAVSFSCFAGKIFIETKYIS